jgi:hypothetical protein
MLRSLLSLPALVGFMVLILSVLFHPTKAAESQESQIAVIQALLRDSRLSDVVTELSKLPQVHLHAQELRKQSRNSLTDVSDPNALVQHAAIQFLHQLCLDAAEHLAPRLLRACFAYVVQQDNERSAR